MSSYAFSAEISDAAASLSAKSAILLDPASGKVLFAKTPHRQQPAASTTKIMTALVVMKKFSLKHIVQVPKSAEYIPKRTIGLRKGERFYVKDLIRAMLITSANDAAHTLAVAVSGSETAFSKLMNREAKRLGAKETRFVNPHGLPHSRAQYSTAYDLALIMKEARKNSFIVETMSRRSATIKALNGRRYYLKSTNKMLWRTSNRVQGKTGYTRKARHCFVGKIRRPSRKDLVVVVMGSASLWRDLTVLTNLCRKMGGGSKVNSVKKPSKQVARLQRALNRAGFSCGEADGIIGDQTTRAVKAFQRRKGLAVDGDIGPKTMAKLKPYLKG